MSIDFTGYKDDFVEVKTLEVDNDEHVLEFSNLTNEAIRLFIEMSKGEMEFDSRLSLTKDGKVKVPYVEKSKVIVKNDEGKILFEIKNNDFYLPVDGPSYASLKQFIKQSGVRVPNTVSPLFYSKATLFKHTHVNSVWYCINGNPKECEEDLDVVVDLQAIKLIHKGYVLRLTDTANDRVLHIKLEDEKYLKDLEEFLLERSKDIFNKYSYESIKKKVEERGKLSLSCHKISPNEEDKYYDIVLY